MVCPVTSLANTNNCRNSDVPIPGFDLIWESPASFLLEAMHHVISGTTKEHHALKLPSQTTQEWENIFSHDETDKELVSKIYKQLL